MPTISLYHRRGLLYLNYRHKKRSVLISTKIHAEDKEVNWITRNNQKQIDKYEPIRRTRPGHTSLNKRIVTQIKKLEKAVADASDLDVDVVKREYEKEEVNKNLLLSECVDIVLDRFDIKQATRKEYGSFKEMLKVCGDVRLSEVDFAYYERFIQCMRTKDYSDVYIDKNVKSIKSVCNKMEAMGYDVHRDFRHFKRVKHTIDKIYLLADELEKVKEVKLKGPLSKQRDVFVLHCSLGLRISDFYRITRDWISKGVLTVPSQRKTIKPIKIPLTKDAIELLEKYGYQMPFITEQVYNRMIKEVCEAADLDRVVEYRGDNVPLYCAVSSKAAKKTFVTQMIELGLNPNEIEVVTGTNASVIRKNYAGELGIKAIAEKMGVSL